MIIVERKHSYIMITQHDHANISGEVAQHWQDEYFFGIEKKDDTVLAVREHDRGWIALDEKPLWNPKKQQPFTFMNYPIEPKLNCYSKGITEVEKSSKYASLLCSLHYTSFLEGANDLNSQQFLMHEKARQQQCYESLGIQGSDGKMKKLAYHLKILKFCDNLSLYLCLNEPGVEKTNEYPFFRDGFSQVFPFTTNSKIQAHWIDQETVGLSITPLKQSLQITLPFKEVSKKHIKETGLTEAYTHTPNLTRGIRLIQA